MKKILIAVDAPGPAEFIAPVLPLLHTQRKLRIVTAHDSAAHVLKRWQPIRCATRREAERAFDSFQPHTLLLGMSSLPKAPVHRTLVAQAARHATPLTAFQDYWGNHRNPENAPIVRQAKKILVPDFFARMLLMEDAYRGEIAITGNPASEKFSRVNVARERSRIRKRLGIPPLAFFVLYAGTGTPQSARADEITFKFFARTIRTLKQTEKNLYVAVRSHPRDERPRRYRALARSLETVDTSHISLTDSLLPAVDAVVSMYSTNLIHACYLRIPAISILLPDAGRRRLREIRLNDFPPNGTGASIGIYKNSPALLLKTLSRLNRDQTFRSALASRQKKHFPPEKGTTRAVCAAIG